MPNIISLNRLAAIAMEAKAKALAGPLKAKIENAATLVHEAFERLEHAWDEAGKLTDLEREIEETDEQELLRKQLMMEISTYKAELTPVALKEAEDSILDSEREIQLTRNRLVTDAAAINKELEISVKAMKEVTHNYEIIRRELGTLSSEAVPEHSEILAQILEFKESTPSGSLEVLVEELDAMASHIPNMPKRELFYQMTIWIGRLRWIQSTWRDQDGKLDLTIPVYKRLSKISKDYEPGSIDAFDRLVQHDWLDYITEAQGKLEDFHTRVRVNK